MDSVVICHTLLNISPAPTNSTTVSATWRTTIARPVIITRRDADTLRPPSFKTSWTFVKHNAIAGPTPNSRAVPMEMAIATAITPRSSVVSVKRVTAGPINPITMLIEPVRQHHAANPTEQRVGQAFREQQPHDSQRSAAYRHA